MVSPAVPVSLKVEKVVLDEYVREVASDPMREVDLGELAGLPAVPASKVVMNERPLTLIDSWVININQTYVDYK